MHRASLRLRAAPLRYAQRMQPIGCQMHLKRQLNRANLCLSTGRNMTTTTGEALAAAAPRAKSRVLYVGGFDKMLRILKRVSIFSCTCTLVGVPLLAVSSNNPRMRGVQKWIVAFVVVAFGVTTTVALHVIAKPYVCKIMADATGELLAIETMNMLGKTKTTNVEFSKLVASEKPWATFGTSANPKLSFFVEEAPDSYTDLKFREKLFAKIGRSSSLIAEKIAK